MRDRVSGLLIAGHNPADYARVLGDLIGAPRLLRRLRGGAIAHASQFGWADTVDRLLKVYTGAMEEHVAAAVDA